MCLQEIRQWMATNWLTFKDFKTVFIFGSKKNLYTSQSQAVTMEGSQISMYDSLKSIGATLDSTLVWRSRATCKSMTDTICTYELSHTQTNNINLNMFHNLFRFMTYTCTYYATFDQRGQGNRIAA